jgi:membrane associated rhomboid family serine protease
MNKRSKTRLLMFWCVWMFAFSALWHYIVNPYVFSAPYPKFWIFFAGSIIGIAVGCVLMYLILKDSQKWNEKDGKS